MRLRSIAQRASRAAVAVAIVIGVAVAGLSSRDVGSLETLRVDAGRALERAGDLALARKNVDRGDLFASYGATTTPVAIAPGVEVPIEVRVQNTGQRTWRAAGSVPVKLSYHWYDAGGTVVVWDGTRATLPHDVQPGDEIALVVPVRAPSVAGTYRLGWDMVQDGSGWFSARAVPMKGETVTVAYGVTLYGKGWGHGSGLSQWGAQGWAQGASGVRLTGEQIVQKYFPGAELAKQPATRPFRVLLSSPSTGCVGRTIADVARLWSAGGYVLVDDLDPSRVFLDAGPHHAVTLWTNGTSLFARDGASGAVVYQSEGALTLVPKQFWDPIRIDQKGLFYRGNIRIDVSGGLLRVVNHVSSDDYMRGALPSEMPSDWHPEALRAQAIAARTYAAWRQSTAGDRVWDLRDDTADQCYGGHSHENPRSNAAVAATGATILLHEGKPIRALYSSSHGGISENVGCLLDAVRTTNGWTCAQGWPYLAVVEDPAELAATDARGANQRGALWSWSFTGDEIKDLIKKEHGVDIGLFVSMEFTLSPGGRPVSVRVRGNGAIVDLKGDRFLRQTLGLRSTLVRTHPF